MDWFDALILGLVQGIAEFLPISSSGHLEIFSKILGVDLNGAEALDFDATLHVATVLSTIVILWHEFVPLCKSFFTFKRDNNTRTVLKILLSCIPVAFVGVLFKDKVEAFFGGGNLLTVGICLLVTASLLTFAWFMRRGESGPYKSGKQRRAHDITWLDSFLIGCAQAVAVLPGLSRSGTTIATGLILGDKREEVARFSFLMVIIPILGQALLSIKDFITDGSQTSVGLTPLLVGFITSFVAGCLACKFMLEVVKRGKLVYFAVYCVIVGVVCICW